MKSKKGQVIIFSVMFLILLLLVSYSQETQNDYKRYFDKDGILNNIMFEVCQVGYQSNGSNLDTRYSTFETDVESYCVRRGVNCSFSTTKDSGAPSNLTLLNYTYYNHSITYNNSGYEVSQTFTC